LTSTIADREHLEAALAQAEAEREHLEAALIEAEAALVSTVTDAAKIDANRAETSANVEKARARCRQLRAALLERGYTEFIRRSHSGISTLFAQSEETSNKGAAVILPPKQLGEHAARDERNISQHESRQRKKFRQFKDVFAASPRVRETIGLLSLVTAYLQYYYFDVQLQIMSLPSVTTFPMQ
jgi:hypothetical protein